MVSLMGGGWSPPPWVTEVPRIFLGPYHATHPPLRPASVTSSEVQGTTLRSFYPYCVFISRMVALFTRWALLAALANAVAAGTTAALTVDASAVLATVNPLIYGCHRLVLVT